MAYLPTVGLITIALFATGLNAVQSSQIISRIKRKPASVWSDVSGACIKGGNERGGIAVSSLADCKRRCETETSFKCRSIGYWKPWWMTTKRLCNLSEDNRQSAGTDYKKYCHIPNYHYSEITQEGNTPVVNYPPQCRDYKVLNEASRHYTQPSGDEKCDKTGDIDMSPQWSGAGWYRFTGAAGTKMATKKEVTKKNICGTSAPGHLDTDEHPDLAEGQSQDQKVCFYWQKIKINDFDQDGKRKIEKDQCYESTNITIQRCDGFYIYKLPKSNFHCENRYCGA